MKSRDLRSLMWGEALSLLEQADRLHRQFFRLESTRAAPVRAANARRTLGS